MKHFVKEIQYPIDEKKYMLKEVVCGNNKLTGIPIEGDGIAGFVIRKMPKARDWHNWVYIKFQLDDKELFFQIKEPGPVYFDNEHMWKWRSTYTIWTDFTDVIELMYIYVP